MITGQTAHRTTIPRRSLMTGTKAKPLIFFSVSKQAMLTTRLVTQFIGCACGFGPSSQEDKTTPLRVAVLRADGGMCAS
jgi:hypothetical protein